MVSFYKVHVNVLCASHTIHSSLLLDNTSVGARQMVVSRSVDILKIRYMFRDVRYVRQKFVLSSILFYLYIYI